MVYAVCMSRGLWKTTYRVQAGWGWWQAHRVRQGLGNLHVGRVPRGLECSVSMLGGPSEVITRPGYKLDKRLHPGCAAGEGTTGYPNTCLRKTRYFCRCAY